MFTKVDVRLRNRTLGKDSRQSLADRCPESRRPARSRLFTEIVQINRPEPMVECPTRMARGIKVGHDLDSRRKVSLRSSLLSPTNNKVQSGKRVKARTILSVSNLEQSMSATNQPS